MPELLLEILSEEIPARMQVRAADNLKRLVTDALVEAGCVYEGARACATPRRLVLSVEGLPATQPDLREERKGPRVDAPDRAIEGFLGSVGMTRDQLETREDKKGTFYVAHIERPGRPASDCDCRHRARHRAPLSLAQVDALGDGNDALGAPAPFHRVHFRW